MFAAFQYSDADNHEDAICFGVFSTKEKAIEVLKDYFTEGLDEDDYAIEIHEDSVQIGRPDRKKPKSVYHSWGGVFEVELDQETEIEL